MFLYDSVSGSNIFHFQLFFLGSSLTNKYSNNPSTCELFHSLLAHETLINRLPCWDERLLIKSKIRSGTDWRFWPQIKSKCPLFRCSVRSNVLDLWSKLISVCECHEESSFNSLNRAPPSFLPPAPPFTRTTSQQAAPSSRRFGRSKTPGPEHPPPHTSIKPQNRTDPNAPE